MNNLLKPTLALASALLLTASAGASIIVTGTNLRRAESATNDAATYSQATDNQGRIGAISGPRHAITQITFDIGSSGTTRDAFEAATSFTFTFDFTGILGSPTAANVEYVGTYTNAFSTTTIWNAPTLASWDNVLTTSTSTGTITLDTANLSSGSINFDDTSNQYAIFRIAMDDRTFMSAGVNFTTSNTASTYSLTAVPEPSTYAAILGMLALAGVALRRRQKSRK
jgi:hypothetical protein